MTDLSPDVVLLAVIEVERGDAIRCQFPSCGHRVYKRIHVVEQEGTLKVIGSDCFEKLIGTHVVDATPKYGSGAGRGLSQAERELLQSNTAALVAILEREHQEALRVRKTAEEELARHAPQRESHLMPLRLADAGPVGGHRTIADLLLPEDIIKKFGPQARREVAQKYGVNSDLPGWQILVWPRIKELAGLIQRQLPSHTDLF